METFLENLKMNKFFKRLALAFAVCLGMCGVAFAEGEQGFDPAQAIETASTTVTTIVTAIGGVLAAAIGLYLAFVGYRKAKEALNKA